MSVHEILMPDPINEIFYAYSDFISCTMSEYYRKLDGTEVYLFDKLSGCIYVCMCMCVMCGYVLYR